MIALVVADSYAIPLVLAVLTGVVSLIAFLFRQNARSNEALATVAQQMKDMDRRTTRIEDRVFNGWTPQKERA